MSKDVSRKVTTVRAGQLHKTRKGAREVRLQTSPNRSELANSPTAAESVKTNGGGDLRGDVDKQIDKLERKQRIVNVQFSVVEASSDARLKLHALSNCMHRLLNAAISEWHRADKKVSTRDSSKLTLDRSSVTAAIKDQMQREREYWEEKVPKLIAAEAKLQARLDAVTRRMDAMAIATAKRELLDGTHQLERARCRATINIPSDIYDAIAYFTSGKYTEYREAAWRGSRSSPTFREGQPVRWRDGSWSITRDVEKKGVYNLVLPVHKEGTRVQHVTVKVIPDGPAMYGWAKRMTDVAELKDGVELKSQMKEVKNWLKSKIGPLYANRKDPLVAAQIENLKKEAVEKTEALYQQFGATVAQCDARLVYSEGKKQWFAKLVGRFSYESRKPGSQVAAMRRGRNNAFVIAFEDGDCKMISGDSVIAFKSQVKARKERVKRHFRSLELGSGARGRGKKRRNAALTRIDDVEARFVDSQCKRWAAGIVRVLKFRGVGRLVVATSKDTKQFTDSVDNEYLQAYLRNWPFAKAFDILERACTYAGIEVEERGDVGFNVRRCPQCRHVHDRRQEGTFTCDVCKPEFKRPSDQILAWNMLVDAVGVEPVKKAEKKKKEAVDGFKSALTPKTEDELVQ